MSSDTSIPQGYKHCSKCGEVKPCYDFGNTKRNGKTVLQYACKKCLAEKARIRYRNNPEKAKETSRNYRKAHPDKIRDHTARYREANSSKMNEATRRWRRNNIEKSRQINRQWKKEHPEANRRKDYVRRVRKLKIPNINLANIEEILFDVQNGYCMYCQCELFNGYDLDHIVPLSLADLLNNQHPGHVPTNLCLACETCNSSKKDAILEDWLTWKYPDQMDEILHRVEQHIEIMREWE